MAVGADERIGVGDFLTVLVLIGPDGLAEILKVHLVADAGAGGHNAEVVKRLLAPLEEGIALDVALIFAVDVHLERARVAEFVDHDGVVDHEVDGVQRVDLIRVAAKRHQTVAHRGEVNDGWNTGEILHQHAGRTVGDFAGVFSAFGRPFGKCLDVVLSDGLAVLETQHVFQNDFQRRWQFGEIAQARSLGGGDGIVGDVLAANGECLACLGTVVTDLDCHGGLPSGSDGWLDCRLNATTGAAVQLLSGCFARICIPLCTEIKGGSLRKALCGR